MCANAQWLFICCSKTYWTQYSLIQKRKMNANIICTLVALALFYSLIFFPKKNILCHFRCAEIFRNCCLGNKSSSSFLFRSFSWSKGGKWWKVVEIIPRKVSMLVHWLTVWLVSTTTHHFISKQFYYSNSFLFFLDGILSRSHWHSFVRKFYICYLLFKRKCERCIITSFYIFFLVACCFYCVE